MSLFDLDDDILPGKRAAGFELGVHLEKYSHALLKATVLEDVDGLNLVKEISKTPGILLVHNHRSSPKNKITVYFKNDTVRLLFNKSERLYCIYLFEGYRGRVFGAIRIGDLLKKLTDKFPLHYDEHDEMHYPDDEKGGVVKGIAFIASDESIEDSPDQMISGMCVHDWSLVD